MKALRYSMSIFALSGVLMAQPANSPKYEDMKLTLKDVIDALVDYDIRHQPLPSMGTGNLYGLFSSGEKRIYLNSEQDRREMIDTIVHELYHAKFHMQGVDDRVSHETIDKFTKQTLLDNYGFSLPVPKKKEGE